MNFISGNIITYIPKHHWICVYLLSLHVIWKCYDVCNVCNVLVYVYSRQNQKRISTCHLFTSCQALIYFIFTLYFIYSYSFFIERILFIHIFILCFWNVSKTNAILLYTCLFNLDSFVCHYIFRENKNQIKTKNGEEKIN